MLSLPAQDKKLHVEYVKENWENMNFNLDVLDGTQLFLQNLMQKINCSQKYYLEEDQ